MQTLEVEIISNKINELKALWPELSDDERKKKLFGLHLMLAASSELIQESALSDIVPELETKAEYRAGIKAARELLNHHSCENQNIVSGERHSIPLFPAEVMTGAAGTFAKIYSQYLEAPPEFLFMSYLTCLGSIIGDEITLESQIEPQPRLYTILIGESADDRKSTAADQTLKFFYWFSHGIAKSATDAELAVCYGVGSAEGLATQLQKNSKLLLFVDELKSLVQKMKGEGSILLPCINTLFESNCFHSATKKHSINLDNVYLGLIGCCTVETYRTMFTSQFLDIGLINRFFVVLGKGKRRFAIPQAIPTLQKSKLYEDLDRVIKLAFSLAEKQAYAMPIEQNALKLFEEWYFNTPRSIFTKRLDTYGHRLMPLLALNEGKNSIDLAVVEAVVKLLTYELEVRNYADPVDAETRIAKIEEQIRRALDRGTHKRRDLERACNKARYGNYLWNWAIDNLIKAREISYDPNTKIYLRLYSEGEVYPPEKHQGMMWEGLYDGNTA